MWELLLRDPYSCTPVCHIVITLEGLTPAIGPAGGSVYVPMRISGGSVTGIGAEKRVICGTDVAVMHGDEKFVHNGTIVIADPAGDVIVWYEGPSQADEGAYDDLLDGRLPGKIPSRVSVRVVSTSPGWITLRRRPLLGVGSFDGTSGTLEFTVLSATETAPGN